MGPDYVKMRDMLQQWDVDEDGSDTECMAGLEMEFLAERLASAATTRARRSFPTSWSSSMRSSPIATRRA